MLTFNEWREHGYGVKKGEKSSHRNVKNEALFTDKQVVSLPVFKNEDELRWENNVAVQDMLRKRAMVGDKFAAMSCDLDRIGSRFGIDGIVNYGDEGCRPIYDACDDMEAF